MSAVFLATGSAEAAEVGGEVTVDPVAIGQAIDALKSVELMASLTLLTLMQMLKQLVLLFSFALLLFM
nr:hypothetical protein [Alteribacillus bidgolensis]